MLSDKWKVVAGGATCFGGKEKQPYKYFLTQLPSKTIFLGPVYLPKLTLFFFCIILTSLFKQYYLAYLCIYKENFSQKNVHMKQKGNGLMVKKYFFVLFFWGGGTLNTFMYDHEKWQKKKKGLQLDDGGHYVIHITYTHTLNKLINKYNFKKYIR